MNRANPRDYDFRGCSQVERTGSPWYGRETDWKFVVYRHWRIIDLPTLSLWESRALRLGEGSSCDGLEVRGTKKGRTGSPFYEEAVFAENCWLRVINYVACV